MTLAASAFPAAQLYKDFPIAHTNSGIQFINIADEYVAWLTIANPGMLAKGNLLCFDYAMSHLPSTNPMVEIGVFAGLSTNLLCYYRRRHGVRNRFVNCDRWLFEGAQGQVGDSAVTHGEFRDFIRESYLRHVRFFSRDDLPQTVEMTSDELYAAWERQEHTADVFGRPVQLGGPISFCYIDGNHSYPFALRDFQNTDRFLEPGGLVLFDDSADGTVFGVGQVIEHLKQLSNYRVVMKNPNYLFQKT